MIEDMTAMNMRRYPIGVQTFSEIIRGEFIYVDKTDLIWDVTKESKYVFLSRPRRFGKSLLSSTLRAYFEGRKDLFEGLKIMQLEKQWTEYPVIHVDLSVCKGMADGMELRRKIMLLLKPYAESYGADDDETTPGGMLAGVIKRAWQKTGRQTVVIIDEYDAPLLDVLHTDEVLSEMRQVMQEFYSPLKASDPYLRFCFITGITKFSQLSIFSTINNLKNITMLPKFSAICGFTEQEVKEVFAEDIRSMAEYQEYSPEEMFQRIKARYDGYHFAYRSEDIYNPFSLLNAFADKELDNYWFATGTPSFLIKQLQDFRTDITAMDDIEVPSYAFDKPTEAITTALPLLYQSGYLTIKGYDKESQLYKLAIPNQEVRTGFTEGLMPTYTGMEGYEVQTGFALKFWRALKKDDVEQAMQELQTYLEGIPYVEGFKKKLDNVSSVEGFYEYTLYLIFSMLNVYVRTQVKCRGGRIDMVVLMPTTTYVFELKTTGTAQEALAQIDDRGYGIAYQTEGRKVVKAGMLFNIEKRTLEDWAIES